MNEAQKSKLVSRLVSEWRLIEQTLAEVDGHELIMDLYGRQPSSLRAAHRVLGSLARLTKDPGSRATLERVEAWLRTNAGSCLRPDKSDPFGILGPDWTGEQAREWRALLVDVGVVVARMSDVAELADEVVLPTLGSGGPGKTFDAALQAIRAKKAKGAFTEGDSTTLESVRARLMGVDPKKAADYLAPSGRLCEHWIARNGDRVLLTKVGATEGNRRLPLPARKQ